MISTWYKHFLRQVEYEKVTEKMLSGLLDAASSNAVKQDQDIDFVGMLLELGESVSVCVGVVQALLFPTTAPLHPLQPPSLHTHPYGWLAHYVKRLAWLQDVSRSHRREEAASHEFVSQENSTSTITPPVELRRNKEMFQQTTEDQT
ncbi:uncharacterized protein LOC125179383 [Hyalella azteca]|uniref:Uncharacterized protein LOC125179383 n=1 Tax=Hyalella azteca TaxID=294128 RepID=A0A979FXB6_HYAAZ|nr:uncharacterized protein LOC125179383 [Hyalella azteca]